jgi:hypothetical protein
MSPGTLRQGFVIGGYRTDGARGVDAPPVGDYERRYAGQRHDTGIDPKAVGAFRLTTGSDRPCAAVRPCPLLGSPEIHPSRLPMTPGHLRCP